MKVRITKRISNLKTAYGPGDELNLPDAQAKALIDSGAAVPVIEDASSKHRPQKAVIR